MVSIYDAKVDPLAPNNAHSLALQLVGFNKNVLELGAAGGSVSTVLKERGNTVVAVERDGRQLDSLQQICDEVLITDLNWLDLSLKLNSRKFEVILAGDVLEHCLHPELVLLQLHDLLAPDGYVIVSIPNIAHADIRLSLLSGKFEYQDQGLLDRTHIRFFTRATFNHFVEDNGFSIDQIFGATVPIGATEFGRHDPNIPWSTIEYIEKDRDATVYQYVSKLVPVEGWGSTASTKERESQPSQPTAELLAEISLLQELLQRHTTFHRLHQLRATQDELRATQDELKRLQLQLLSARDNAIGITAELGEARHRAERAQKESADLRLHIKKIQQSRTWKIGRLVLLPLRVIRRLLRS